MSEVIDIFDIAEVDKIFSQMPPVKGVSPVELKNHFIVNYISREKDIHPVIAANLPKAYFNGKVGKRYLIDKNDPLIAEIHQYFTNEAR